MYGACTCVCVFGHSHTCMGVHTCMYACIVNIFYLCFKFLLTFNLIRAIPLCVIIQ